MKWLLRLLRREAEARAVEQLLKSHWPTVREYVHENFPSHRCQRIAQDHGWAELVEAVAKRACQRLLEHIL